MPAKVDVYVDGFKQLSKKLKDTEPALAKAFKVELKAVAEKIAEKVRDKIPSITGTAAKSVKAGADAKSAYVKGGQKSVPYYGWLDFGGTLKATGKRYGVQRRTVEKKGRYLYPTVEESRDESLAGAREAFEKAARQVGLQ